MLGQQTLQQYSDLSCLTRLHLVRKSLQKSLCLARLHRPRRKHLERRLQPASRFLRHYLEECHHHSRSIRETVAREDEHHSGQDSLGKDLALRCDELSHGLLHLGWVGVRRPIWTAELRHNGLVECKAEQVTVVVQCRDKWISLL